MKLFFLLACWCIAYSSAYGGIVADVRASLGTGNFPQAEALISKYRAEKGVTHEMIAAYSWLGRAALAAKKFDEAERYAATTKKLAVAELRTEKLDTNPNADLSIALGAAIHVSSLPPVVLDPHTFFLLFLPPLLFLDGWRIPNDGLMRDAPTKWSWHGRHVKVVDGSTASMPDTKANQKEYP